MQNFSRSLWHPGWQMGLLGPLLAFSLTRIWIGPTRIWIGVLLAAPLLSMGAASASAYSLRMDRSDGNGRVTSGDSVIVDLYLDAEPGLWAFSVGVLYDPAVLIYNGAASAVLPAKGPGSSGAQPSYILYAPAGALPAVALYPIVTPSFNTWVAPPPGLNQVNVDFLTSRLIPPTQSTSASGTNIYIASLVFVVGVGYSGGTTEIRLCNPGELVPGGNTECGGNVFGTADPTILNERRFLH